MKINKDKVKEMDSNWKEVMRIAEENGFILDAYSGTASLATINAQIEFLGEKEFIKRFKARFGEKALSKIITTED
ncbi:hypothetical protein [Enterococcus sp. AZ126]|uniref:hypothetical protein n=1 Tax=Enterococcus sp. AZ126 TaxID=2774635 RepID=UPI003F232B50